MKILTVIAAGLLATSLAMPAMAGGSKDMPKAKAQQSQLQKSGKIQRTAMIRKHRKDTFRQANAMSPRTKNANASAKEPVMDKYPSTLAAGASYAADPVCKPGQLFKGSDGQEHRCQ